MAAFTNERECRSKVNTGTPDQDSCAGAIGQDCDRYVINGSKLLRPPTKELQSTYNFKETVGTESPTHFMTL